MTEFVRDPRQGYPRRYSWLALATAFLIACLAVKPSLAAPPPSLVVVISVDQLSSEEITRLRPWFGYDGFNRFLKKGAEFPHASYRHAGTFTGPGHASVGTGLDPNRHGIVGNAWFDPVERKIVHCVEDRKETLVGVPEIVATGGPERVPAGGGSADVHPDVPTPIPTRIPAAASPRRLRTASAREPSSKNLPYALGDRVKLAFPGSRVVAVGLKDRSAILMAGKDADGAAWFPDALGRFVTSSYYPRNEFVEAVLAFDKKLPKKFATPACTVWEPLGPDAFSPRVPFAMLSNVLFDPPELFAFKSPFADMGATFPHPLSTPKAKVYSPCGDSLVLDLARSVILKMELGTRSTSEPDLLFVALSSMDYIGHMFGPDSREVADGVLRLDRSLESFFQWLDENVSRRRVLIWLTSDHGVTPIPEVAMARPRPASAPSLPARSQAKTSMPSGDPSAGRVDLDLKREDTGPMRDAGASRLAIERTLAANHGYELHEDQPNRSEGVIAYFVEPCFVLNREVIERRAAALEGGPRSRSADGARLMDGARSMDGDAGSSSVPSAGASSGSGSAGSADGVHGSGSTAAMPDARADGVPGSGSAAATPDPRSEARVSDKPADATDDFHEVGAGPAAAAGSPGPAGGAKSPDTTAGMKGAGSGARTGTPEQPSMTIESVRIELRNLLRQVPGVLEAYTHDEIAKGLPRTAPFADAFARSFDAERTGDVCAVLRPGWIWSNEPKGTTHGQPHPADASVPLLVWGAGVRQGASSASVSPLAIATTTAALFGLDGVGEPDVPPLGAVLAGYKVPKRKGAATR